AVLAVLLLRGPQTPGELKARTERMAEIESLEHVDQLLGSLSEHGFVQRLERRPGQKEDRFMQLLGGGAAPDADQAQPAPALATPVLAEAPRPMVNPLSERVSALEREV